MKTPKPKPAPKTPADTAKERFDFRTRQLMVERFCAPPINWGKEMRMAASLLREFPDRDFWLWLPNPSCNSLLWMGTPRGKVYLAKQSQIFNLTLTEKPPVILSETTQGENKTFEHKPSNILEFTNAAQS